ncbi:hypothetical protein RND81_07G177000 [Saponaria officinalis]|uniref:DUF7912 domain-containing protein n=1 Tax=Saponaria officinalis TaxID=3572 RepID=A0AAW1JTE1_SAPOF
MKKLLTLLKNTITQKSLIQQFSLNYPTKSLFSSSFPLKTLLNPSQISPICTLHTSFPPNFSGVSSFAKFRSFSTSEFSNDTTEVDYETDRDLVIEEWEEEDDTEPEIGDGGAGGGIVLQNVPWGEKVLSIARDVLLQFGDDVKLYSFKTTPGGYIYIRLDKLTNEYGCPGIEEVENYSREYKKRLDEEGSKGQIPDDLALEVSSPGAERLLMVPDDLHRFKDFPMVVSYFEETDTQPKTQEKTRVFFLDSIETETEHCVWKLADVRENRDPASKGRPLNRKQRDWRLKLPYKMLKKVSLYLEF